jgi:hypothetical protein
LSVDNLAEQNCAPIAQLRDKMTELVTGVRHGYRLSRIRHQSPCKHFESLGTGKPIRVKPEVQRKFSIEADKPRSLHRGRRYPSIKAVGQTGVRILKGKVQRHWIFRSSNRLEDLHIVHAGRQINRRRRNDATWSSRAGAKRR